MAEPGVASGAALQAGPSTRHPGAPSRWLEWRYAVAGLGWGTLVGVVTGVLLALWIVVPSLLAGGAGVSDWFWLLTLAPFAGALWGGLTGFVSGGLAGLVSALVLPHVRGARARWWVALVIPAVVAVAAVAVLFSYDRSAQGPGMTVEAGSLVVLLPPVALGILMARSSRSISRERARLSTT